MSWSMSWFLAVSRKKSGVRNLRRTIIINGRRNTRFHSTIMQNWTLLWALVHETKTNKNINPQEYALAYRCFSHSRMDFPLWEYTKVIVRVFTTTELYNLNGKLTSRPFYPLGPQSDFHGRDTLPLKWPTRNMISDWAQLYDELWYMKSTLGRFRKPEFKSTDLLSLTNLY